MRGRGRLGPFASGALATLLGTCAALALASPAGPTTIGFDDLAAGTLVADQYAGQGVTFGTGPNGATSIDPTVASDATNAHSGPNVALIGFTPEAGTPHTDVWAAFSTPQQTVAVYAGDPYDHGSTTSRTLQLDAYAADGSPLASRSVVLARGGKVDALLEYDAPDASIAYVRLHDLPAADATRTAGMAIDDLTFAQSTATTTTTTTATTTAPITTTPPPAATTTTTTTGTVDGQIVRNPPFVHPGIVLPPRRAHGPALRVDATQLTFPVAHVDCRAEGSCPTLSLRVANDGPGSVLAPEAVVGGRDDGDFNAAIDSCRGLRVPKQPGGGRPQRRAVPDARASQVVEGRLAAGGSCIVDVTFAPTQTVARQATLQVVAEGATNRPRIDLSGYGTSSFEIRVTGMDVSQAIQSTLLDYARRDLNGPAQQSVAYNGVDLAAGKTTVVRVFADAVRAPTGGVPGVTAYLYGSRDGRPLPGSPLVTTINDVRTLHTSSTPGDDRDTAYAEAGGGYEFTLPDDWADGTIALRAELAGPDAAPDPSTPLADWQPCASADCRSTASLEVTGIPFTHTKSLEVVPYAVDYVSAGKLRTPPPVDDVFREFRAVTPVADDGLVVDPYAATIDATSCGADQGCMLDDVTDTTFWRAFLGADVGSVTLGVVGPGYNADEHGTPIAGLTRPFPLRGVSRGIAVVDATRPLTSVSHELFHALGFLATGSVLPHASASCGGGDADNDLASLYDKDKVFHDDNDGDGDLQPSEPWPADERGDLQGHGIDPSFSTSAGYDRLLAPQDDTVFTRTQYFDFMSYCTAIVGRESENSGTADVFKAASEYYNPDGWVSVHNWLRLLGGLKGTGLAGAVPRARAATRSGATQLFVAGHENPDGSLALPVVDPDAPAGALAPVQGSPYTATLRDAEGRVVGSAPMSVELAHSDPGPGKPPRAFAAVAAELPASPLAATLQVTDPAGAVVATRTRSAHAPVVRLRAPRAGATVGAAGSVTIGWRMSDADGDPLRTRVEYSADGGVHYRPIFFGGAETSVRVPAASLPASRDARLRVLVSDGFNQTRVVSPRFRSLGAAPMVTLGAIPARASTDAPVNLAAGAIQDDGRRVPGARIAWTANGRALGSGASLATLLPAGRVVVAAAARGADGRVGRASTTVVVRAVAPRIIALHLLPSAGRRTLRLRLATDEPARLGPIPLDRNTRTIALPQRHRLHRNQIITLRITADKKKTRVPIAITS